MKTNMPGKKNFWKEHDSSQFLLVPFSFSRLIPVKAQHAWAKSNEKVLLESCQNPLHGNPGTNHAVNNTVLLQ